MQEEGAMKVRGMGEVKRGQIIFVPFLFMYCNCSRKGTVGICLIVEVPPHHPSSLAIFAQVNRHHLLNYDKIPSKAINAVKEIQCRTGIE